jgi:hypothetical protein
MTDRAVSNAADEAARAPGHSLTHLGFDALVAGAAKPRPGALACRDEGGGIQDVLTYADLCQRVGACLEQLREIGFAPGEKAILTSPPGAQAFVVLTALLAARVDPVLAAPPSGSTKDAVAAAAKRVSATAIFAPAYFCGVDFGGSLMGVAARTHSIRLIGTLAGALDCAVDFSARRHAAMRGRRLIEDWGANPTARVGAIDDDGEVHFLSQSSLIAAALDLVRATRRQEQRPILSLLAPTSFGALVAGPLAALISGAPLHFLTPFVPARFRQTLEELGPVRLVAPVSALAHLRRAGLLDNGAFAGVVAVASGAPVDPVAAGCPVVILREAGGAIYLDSPPHAPPHTARGASGV